MTVTDKAGNTATYTITVYKNYTVTYVADGQTLSTETVGHGKDATLPAVPAKDGYTGAWDSDGKNITENTTIRAVYTAIPAERPADPPATGDNSHLWLCFALLLVSGAGVFGVSLTTPKRKVFKK